LRSQITYLNCRNYFIVLARRVLLRLYIVYKIATINLDTVKSNSQLAMSYLCLVWFWLRLLTLRHKWKTVRVRLSLEKQLCLPWITKKLMLFDMYVWLGLGTLYGDSDLKEQMDSASIMKTVESTLWKHFERFVYVFLTFTILYLPYLHRWNYIW